MPDVKIYTTNYCFFCKRAVSLLKNLNIPFEQIPVDDKPEVRQKLADENNGYRTVPMIFIGNEFIGGCQELESMHAAGELKKRFD